MSKRKTVKELKEMGLPVSSAFLHQGSTIPGKLPILTTINQTTAPGVQMWSLPGNDLLVCVKKAHGIISGANVKMAVLEEDHGIE